MQLMNILWEVDVKQWLERIKEFMEWLDWKMAKGKSHHIFPFAYDEVHEKLNYGQLITQAAVGQVMGFFRHWSILYRKPNWFVHLNSWELSHMKKQVALFFKKLEVDLVKVWDDEGKAIISSLSWKKLQSPTTKEYIVHVLHDVKLVLAPQGRAKRPRCNC